MRFAKRSIPMFVVMAFAVAALALLWPTSATYAHGESVEVVPAEAAPGDTVTIRGQEFTPGEEVEISLESARGSVSLGHAEVDESGDFSVSRQVPDNVSPGSYQVVVATGDDSITVDFTVLQSTSEGTEAGASGGTVLIFQRSTAEVIAIGIISAALILAGAYLVVAGTRQRA